MPTGSSTESLLSVQGNRHIYMHFVTAICESDFLECLCNFCDAASQLSAAFHTVVLSFNRAAGTWSSVWLNAPHPSSTVLSGISILNMYSYCIMFGSFWYCCAQLASYSMLLHIYMHCNMLMHIHGVGSALHSLVTTCLLALSCQACAAFHSNMCSMMRCMFQYLLPFQATGVARLLWHCISATRCQTAFKRPVLAAFPVRRLPSQWVTTMECDSSNKGFQFS